LPIQARKKKKLFEKRIKDSLKALFLNSAECNRDERKVSGNDILSKVCNAVCPFFD